MPERKMWKLWVLGLLVGLAGCDPVQPSPVRGRAGAPSSRAPEGGVGGVIPPEILPEAPNLPVGVKPVPPVFTCSGGRGANNGVGGSPSADDLVGSTVVRADVAPPPISGGTLLTTKDGTLIVASDPDRDQIYFVDAKAETLLHVRKLKDGDEPGRLVEDAAGRIHVVLRSGHALASLTREPESAITRREVCSVPRGVAYDAGQDLLHVACAEGKLVSLGAAPDRGITRTLDVGRDARDVLVRDGRVFVSHFRSSELLVLEADGSVAARIQPPTFMRREVQSVMQKTSTGCVTTQQQDVMVAAEPTVAYRMLDVPELGITMLHQRSKQGLVQTMVGGYGSGTCGSGIVQTSITTGMDTARMSSVDMNALTLAVDIATDPDGALLAVVAPGNAGAKPQLQVISLEEDGQLFRYGQRSAGAMTPNAPKGVVNGGSGGTTGFGNVEPCITLAQQIPLADGATERAQVTAVTFASAYMIAVQAREPAGLYFVDARTNSVSAHLDFSQPTRFDTGHAMFHARAGAGVACASCHAEAGDDGHTWDFEGIGARRTQTLRGGLLGTEPFHWNGDMKDFDMLVHEVFVGRMSGFEPNDDQTYALSKWIDKQPALRATPSDEAAAERGKALFESAAVGCATCHTGAHLTNNLNQDVGTGAVLQVPSLHGLAFRAPFLHNGCAATLKDRFTPSCGGGDKHGKTSQLSAVQLDDLISYLDTL